MQTTQALNNSDFSLNSNGYLDVLRNRMTPFALTAGALAAINTLDVAIIAERNYIHSAAILNDGITDVTVVSVTHGADDGPKLRYIAKGLIDAIEANIMFPGNVDQDQTILWGSILSPAPAPIKNTPNPKAQKAQTFKSYVTPTMGTPGYTASTRTLRLAVIDAAYALYAAVAAL